MRRATGPMLAAWLFATVGAVGVAWFGVHPVADLGFAKRPPVPQPHVATSPEYDTGNDSSDNTGPGGPNPERPTIENTETSADEPTTKPRESSPSASASPSPSKSPIPATPRPSLSSTASPTGSPPATVYREAATTGGTATFEYVENSDVYVIEAEPKPGWDVGAYRYYRDWVVVEFVSATHRSEAHAYIEGGRAVIEVVEEENP